MTDTPSERLHPEGAPGVAQQMLRGVLGDKVYETLQEHGDQVREHEQAIGRAVVQRAQAVAAMYFVACLTLLAVAPALTIWAWKAAL